MQWFSVVICIFAVISLWHIESLLTNLAKRVDQFEDSFKYDWTHMSGELRISAYKREGGLICRAEQQFLTFSAGYTMPVTGDWFIFAQESKIYRGEIVGREIRFEEVDTQTSPDDATSRRMHMIVRVDVVCDDEHGWSPLA